jgi:L-2,4-diaminobutyrate transaminase
MAYRSNELEAWDRDHLFHPSTHMAGHARGMTPNRIITSAEGVYITDSEGHRSLDGFAGLYCVNVGYGRTEIAEAITAQVQKLPYFHAYSGHGSEPSIRLAKMIIDRAPQNMSRVYFGLSGSDANETCVKLAWYYNAVRGLPEKRKIIARWGGYHGSGVMTGSLTGLATWHRTFGLPLPGVLHTESPYYYRRADRSQSEEAFSQHCADRLEEMILAEGPDTIAAFFGEPVIGTGGIVPPPKGYWERISAVLQKYDILLVADEVVTGFGRLGSMFGSDHYGMKPDLIAIAKGLTSAYAPLSGVIVSDKLWHMFESGSEKFGPIGHGWTYSAHPLCAAAGIANLELIDQLNLVENARVTGAYLKKAMADAVGDHPMVGEVRGEGLLVAIELVADRDDRVYFDPAKKIGIRVYQETLARGVIGRAMPNGDVLGFGPPLCLSTSDVEIIVEATRGALDAVADEFR